MVMGSHGRHLLDLQGLFCRNPLMCSVPVGGVRSIDNLFGEFAGPGAVPICQIVCVEMMKMTMDNFEDEVVMMDDFEDFDDEVAQTSFVYWEGRVDKNVLLVDVQS